MIIDVHGHLSAPAELYSYKTSLLSSRRLSRPPEISQERWTEATERHIKLLDGVGTDIQFISPRPFQLMHNERPEAIVRRWVEANNDAIAEVTTRYAPDRFRGIAGLPQGPAMPVELAAAELDRAVRELGFIGCLINPDPTEGTGEPPTMGQRYWYPLYEKMCELDVPGLVHSAGCISERKSYSQHFIAEEDIAILSLVDSDVFTDFPGLKLIIAHGGGSIPYQIGRWRAGRLRRKDAVDFDTDLRRLWFDTSLYNKTSIEHLIKTVGADRVMFATEKPGTGSSFDPVAGRWLDDLRPVVEDIDWLSEQERGQVFADNARACYTHLKS